jgi:DNA polymerase III alpha subunit (gram-positive type)
MTYIMIDVESDGPIPGDYSMLSFGAVVVDKKLNRTFYAELRPISKRFEKNRITFTGFERKKLMKNEDPKITMKRFVKWIKDNSDEDPVFISDNNGYDWMFVCWYLWHFTKENPFGYSSKNLTSVYKGLNKDMHAKLDSLRTRELSHNALEDAKDNAKIFLKIIEKYKLKI